MTEISVTPKGQVTIPIKLRKKFKINPGSKVDITEKEGKIMITKIDSIFDLAGAGNQVAAPEEVKAELDEMRERDAE